MTDFTTVFDTATPGPIVLGGGVMPHLPGVPIGIAKVVEAAGLVPEIHVATDGAIGAIVLALRAAGITVDEAMFAAIGASVGAYKSKVPALP